MIETSVKYTVEKSKYYPCYILWKETTSKHGMCCRGIFKGTRDECIQEKDKLLKKKGKSANEPKVESISILRKIWKHNKYLML